MFRSAKLKTAVLMACCIALATWGCSSLEKPGAQAGAKLKKETPEFSWSKEAGRKIAHPEAIVDADWLQAHHKDPDVVILDGSDIKDDTYAPHTVKGAVHIPYRNLRQASGLMKGITFGLEKKTFDESCLEKIFRKAGVKNDSTVVCAAQYRIDDAGVIFWALKWLGHKDVRLLPSNYLKVLPKDMISTSVCKWNAADRGGDFKAEPDWSWYADRGEVVDAMHDNRTGLWDTRSESYFSGTKSKTIRGGTFATAECFSHSEIWKDKAQSVVDWGRTEKKLAELFTCKDGSRMKIISFCNSGHACTVGYFAWQLGYEWAVCDASWNVLAYDGSLPAQNVQFFFKP